MKTLLALIFFIAFSVQGSVKRYTVTSYCACSKCCGPFAEGVTASGRRAQEGVSIAAPSKFKFGTWVNIQGVGRRRVDDRLAPKYNNRIDIFFISHERAKQFGKKVLLVER